MARAPKINGRAVRAAPKAFVPNKTNNLGLFNPGPRKPTAAQSAVAAANTQRQFGLQIAAQARMQARTLQVAASKSSIRANAIRRTYQIAAQGSLGSQQGAMITSLQSRYVQASFLARQAAYAARSAQLYAHQATMNTQTYAQAAASNAAFYKQNKQSQASFKAYFAKLSKQNQKHVAHMNHLMSLKSRGRTLSAHQSAVLHQYQKQTAAAMKAQKAFYNSFKAQPKARGAIAQCEQWGYWLHGFNDEHDTCIATAIANRLMQLGVAGMDNGRCLRLYDTLGIESIEDALMKLCILEPELAYALVPDDQVIAGLHGVIFGFEAETGPHAALADEGQMVSWGGTYPLPDNIEEAWWLGWADGRSPGY